MGHQQRSTNLVNNNPYAPWCWNIYQHLPQKSPSFVGKYTIHGYTWSIWDNLSNQIPAPFKAIYFSSVEAAAIIPDPVISATQQSHSAALLLLRVPGRDTGNVGNGRKFRGSEAHGDQDFPTSVLRHWHWEPITARMKPILIVYQHHSTPKKKPKSVKPGWYNMLYIPDAWCWYTKTYKTGSFWGQMLVFIFQHHGAYGSWGLPELLVSKDRP